MYHQKAASQTESRWKAIGPTGRTVLTMAIHVVDTSVVYAGLELDGLYRSRNGGFTWEETSLKGTVRAIALDARNSSVVYAGGFMGLARSKDQGFSWEVLLEGSSGIRVSAVLVDPTDPRLVYAAAERFDHSSIGIYVSVDGGDTWRLDDTWPQGVNVHSLALDPTHPPSLFAGSSSGTYRKDPLSSVWSPYGLANKRVVALEIAPEGRLLALTSKGGIFKRPLEEGGGWVVTHPETLATDASLDVGRFSINRNGSTEIYCSLGRTKVLKSTNLGDAWTAFELPHPRPVNVVLPHPYKKNRLYAGLQEDGVFLSRDHGDSWEPVVNGMAGQCVVGLASTQAPVRILAGVCGSRGGIYRLSRGSLFWEKVLDDGVRSFMNCQLNPATVYALLEKGGLARSLDAGSTWEEVALGDTVAGSKYLSVHPEDPHQLMVGGGGPIHELSGIWWSRDGGLSWESTVEGLADPMVTGLFFANVGRVKAFAGSEQGLMVWNDSTATWTPTGLKAAGIRELYADPDSPLMIASNQDSIFRTNDRGRTWERLYSPGASTILVDPDDERVFYVGFDQQDVSGVYSTLDAGWNWNGLNRGLSSRAVMDMIFEPGKPTIIYAATSAGGIYRITDLPRGATRVAEEAVSIPTGFYLDHSFPNPLALNYRTVAATIKYGIPELGRVRLEILNTMGQKVKLLVNGEQSPGEHTAHWSGVDERGRPVSTGVYLYRLMAGDLVESKKLILVR